MEHRQIDSKMIEVHSPRKNKRNVDPNAPIIISKNDGRLNISINLDYIQNTPNFDIVKTISLAISPIFTNKDKPHIQKAVKDLKITGFPHVAFFIEDMGHYTGGRYSSWLQAVILSNFTKVTVISNSMPVFYNDFKDYIMGNDNFTFIQDAKYLSDNDLDENSFDIIVGLPNISGQFATSYAQTHKLPLYLVIFETPNWIREYRDGDDAHEDYWESYKQCLKQANAIITISKESKYWIQEWDTVFQDIPIHVIYPCMNELVAMKTVAPDKIDKIQIIFTSRMAPFKNPTAIIKKLPKNIKFVMVGKIWKDDEDRLDKLLDDGYDIEILKNVPDRIKFKKIAESSILIHPSKFEGFGMPPMEGLYFNKPVIAFDLPVLREVYGNDINYVEIGDRQAFLTKILEVSKNPSKFASFNNNPSSFPYISSNLEKQKEIFNMPKISFGVLAYNCGDYLEAAIKSIYDLAHEIIIVEGAVKGYATPHESTDNTQKVISRLVKHDHYKKIIRYKKDGHWKDKIEMQNVIAKNITGDFYIKMDADEIWKPEVVMFLINMMLNNPDIVTVKMPFLHFWTNFETVAKDAGGKWGTKHHRIWRWKKSFKHRKSFNHFIDTANDNRAVVSPYVVEYEHTGEPIFHMGYARPLAYIKQKLKYYEKRGIEKIVIDTYTPWNKMTDPTQPTQKVRSWAEKFLGELPDVLKEHSYFGMKDVRIMEVKK